MFADILTEGWCDCTVDDHPIDRRMRVIVERGVDGMSTENVRYLINEIVRRYAQGGTYLEVGSYRGCSLLSAAIFNPTTLCVGIDDFSGFKESGDNRAALHTNIEACGSPPNIEFYECSFLDGLRRFRAEHAERKVDVYFYDASHDYVSQVLGLVRALPLLAERCLIVVDDLNWEGPDAANRFFVQKHPEFRVLYRQLTPKNASPTWWNGIEVIGRGIE